VRVTGTYATTLAAEPAEMEPAERAQRDADLKAAQKAVRDQRYAARNAAKKERRKGDRTSLASTPAAPQNPSDRTPSQAIPMTRVTAQ
jgi:hypothetical protein